MKKLFFISIYLFHTWGSNAQNFPVELAVVITPPYSLNLSDYFLNQKATINLYLQDLNKIDYPVTIKMSLINSSTRILLDNSANFNNHPVYLQGGYSYEVDLNELIHTFDPVQLNQEEHLDEGYYQFCIEAYDFQTNVPVSLEICGGFLLYLDDAPSISYPTRGSVVEAGINQQLNLTWSHFPVNTSQESIDYEILIYEKTDQSISEWETLTFTQPVFTAQTENLYFSIDEMDYLLEPGINYLVMIKARSDLNDHLFKNNGCSELIEFQYGIFCPPAENIVVASWHDKATLNWNADFYHTGFDVYIKEAGEAAWQVYDVDENYFEISQLTNGATYYYKILSSCANQLSEFSLPDSFYIEENNLSFSCQNLDAPHFITETAPNYDITTGDHIAANGFKVQIGKIQYHDEFFTGNGFIQIPYLNNAKVYVTFENIVVNSNNQLIKGSIQIKSLETELSEDAAKLSNLLSQVDQVLETATKSLNDAAGITSYIHFITQEIELDSSAREELDKQLKNIEYAEKMIQEAKKWAGQGNNEKGSEMIAKAKNIIEDAKTVIMQLFGTLDQLKDLITLLKNEIFYKSDSLNEVAALIDSTVEVNSGKYHQQTLSVDNEKEILENQVIKLYQTEQKLNPEDQQNLLNDSRLKDPLSAYNKIMHDLNNKKQLWNCIENLSLVVQNGALKKLVAEFRAFIQHEKQNFNWSDFDITELEARIKNFLDLKILSMLSTGNP